MTTKLFTPIALPGGAVLPNRIAKAAMEENMADNTQIPGNALFQLYRTWSLGGTGLLITGNVMIDHRAMTSPGGIVLEKNTSLDSFRSWADAAHSGDSKVWMQISHPGRQIPVNVKGLALAPSAIRLDVGKHSKHFSQPAAMTELQIDDVVQRFVDTASQAQKAGFDGVQIHAAHGYLISQFLSPLSNHREDQWGGSLSNRAKLLLDVTKAIRAEVATDFAVSVKLNSADFQRGGFSPEDAEQVVVWLNDLGVDLIELSGGSYEAPAMQGNSRDEHTLAREAYFVEFASKIAAVSKVPIMTTGGIRRLEIAQQVVNKGVSVVGIATALALQTDLPKQWKSGVVVEIELPKINFKDKTMSAMATMAMVKRQLRRIGRNKKPTSNMNPLWTIISDQWLNSQMAKRYLAWRDTLV